MTEFEATLVYTEFQSPQGNIVRLSLRYNPELSGQLSTRKVLALQGGLESKSSGLRQRAGVAVSTPGTPALCGARAAGTS